MNCPRKFLTLGLGRLPGRGWLGHAASCTRPSPDKRPAGRSPGTGQAPSLQKPDPRARIRTTVSLVVVPVTVKTHSGELVTDLQQNDFRIFEDGIEQPIADFSVEAFPLSAAILIDDDLKRSTADRVQKTLADACGRIQRVRRGVSVALR